MANKFRCVVLWASQVTVHDAVITATCAQETTVPGDGADATIVATKRANKLTLRRVPDLQVSRVRANSKKCAIARPLNACYTIVGPNVTQLCYFARAGRPEVNAGAKADCEHVLR